MAGEITITSRLEVKNGNLQYVSKPDKFLADQSLAVGPTPGIITATTSGTVVTFDALTQPGVCRLQNQDSTNYVEVGLSDGSFFYPLLELLPGETYAVRLYRNLDSREALPGTGSAMALSLMIRAKVASCKVLVEIFNK